MSKTKRKKQARSLKTRKIITAVCLIAALGVFILGVRDYAINGLSGTSAQYGVGVLVLLFGSGFFGGALLDNEIKKRNRVASLVTSVEYKNGERKGKIEMPHDSKDEIVSELKGMREDVRNSRCKYPDRQTTQACKDK